MICSCWLPRTSQRAKLGTHSRIRNPGKFRWVRVPGTRQFLLSDFWWLHLTPVPSVRYGVQWLSSDRVSFVRQPVLGTCFFVRPALTWLYFGRFL